MEFWAPIDDSWWNKGITPRLDRRCSEFAKRWNPDVIIPDMIADLKAEWSEVRCVVYIDVLRHWPKKRVLTILTPYRQSRDADVAQVATDFYADVE